MTDAYARYSSDNQREESIEGQIRECKEYAEREGITIMSSYIDRAFSAKTENRFQIDPIAAPHILNAFMRYSNGDKIQDITDDLNAKGLRSFRGNPLNFNNTTNLLKNRRYTGEYKYRNILDPNGIPEIVPMELFERVQQRMEKNKKSPARFKADELYLLSTKLRCGRCGSLMIGESGKSKTGKMHYYYKCGSAKRKTGCKKKAIKKDWIENIVIGQIQKLILDDALLSRITDLIMEVQARENISLPLLRKRLTETEKGIENMLNAIQAGIFTTSTKERLEALEETKRELEISIMQEELQKPTLSPKQIKFFLNKFREFDILNHGHRQRLVDSFINAIFVFDDKLVFTFNYKDSEKTLSLEDLRGSDLESLPAPRKWTPSYRNVGGRSLQIHCTGDTFAQCKAPPCYC